MVNVEFEVYPKLGEAYTGKLTLTDNGFDELRKMAEADFHTIVCSMLGIDPSSVSRVVVLKNG